MRARVAGIGVWFPERIRENFAVFDFELSEDDMAAIARLDRGERTGPDPATFSVR